MSVFTKVSHSELEAHLRLYPVGALLGCQGIGEGVENTNYFVDTADGRWVLTLFERTEASGLPFFLGLMEHLGTRGYPAALPLRSRDGRLCTELKSRPAALVRRLTGNNVLRPTLDQCAAIGMALAELHLEAASFPLTRANDRGAAWRAAAGARVLPRLPPAEAQLVADELAVQAGLEAAALPQGVIHADLFRDNALFVDQRLTGVIDFYYACVDALAYDLAVAVNDWCAEADGRLNRTRAQALLDTYRARRQPAAAEIAAWPLMLRAAALRFYLSRACDWYFPRTGDLVHVKDPAPFRRILEAHRAQPPPRL
ncbi:MAG: homoserine kinase [Gammaproteobacteria bacterium]|nr:homoserine kinase [Gammaproteobacteria bacterium]